MTEEVIKSPKLFVEQLRVAVNDRSLSIEFIKIWQKDVFVNVDTGDKEIDKHKNFTQDMAILLNLLKIKHKITEEEINEYRH